MKNISISILEDISEKLKKQQVVISSLIEDYFFLEKRASVLLHGKSPNTTMQKTLPSSSPSSLMLSH